jgi:hypothetical protein
VTPIVPSVYPPDGTLALMVAVFAWTPSTVKAPLVALAAIDTDAGVTVAVATALLASVMVTPPAGAGLASTIVPVTAWVAPIPMLVVGMEREIVRRLTLKFVMPSVKPVANAVNVAEPLFAAVATLNAAVVLPVSTHTPVAGFSLAVEITPIDGTLKAN